MVLINIGNAFYYPWLLPMTIFFYFKESGTENLLVPVILFAAYFIAFSVLAVAHFVRMDIDNKAG